MHAISTLWQKVQLFCRRLREKAWLNWLVAGIATLFLPLIYQYLIEFVRMRSLTRSLEYFFLRFGVALFGWIVIAALFAAILFISARPWVAHLSVGTLLWAAAYAHYYKLMYRDSPLMYNDILQMREAFGIAKNFSVPPTREIILFALFILLVTVLLLPFRLPVKKGKKSLVARVLVPLLCGAFIPLYVFGFMSDREQMDRLGVSKFITRLPPAYYRNTFVTAFLYFLARSGTQAPSGYSAQTMRDLALQLQEQDGQNPDVIIILLESFADVTTYPGFTFSEDLFANYNRLGAEGIAGSSVSQNAGGGTANAEFSVLSGFATGLLPDNSVPYIEYVKPDFPSLPAYYQQNGYRTVAIHPYQRIFYNRNAAYPNMHFDEFYDETSFSENDILGEFISDDAFADMLIAEYKKSLASGQPVFIHGVTMQNHGAYPPGRYTDEHKVTASSGGYGDFLDEALATYATGIRDTDAMLGKLADYFSTVDREVVLLAFGDHIISIGDENDVDLLHRVRAEYPGSATQQWLSTRETKYLMWSNTYKTDGQQGPMLAPYFLMPVLMREYGLQTPGWMNWLGGIQPELSGYIDGAFVLPDGTVSETPTPRQQEILDTYAFFQYDIMFGKQYALQAMYG